MAESKVPVKNEKTSQPARAERISPFDSLRQEIDRLFDDFRPFGWRTPSTRSLLDMPSMRTTEWMVAPAMDLVEKDGAYEISAELPGLDENNVEVKVANDVLTIKGAKKEEKEEKDKDYHLSERRYGSFQRSFYIPEGVNVDKITADFSKGVLTVGLPKTPEAKKAEKKIEVKAA